MRALSNSQLVLQKLALLPLTIFVFCVLPCSAAVAYDVTTIVDTNKAHTQFFFSSRMFTDAKGKYMVASDNGRNNIWRVYFDGNGSVELLAGAADGASGFADGTANKARFHKPMGLDVDSQGNVYVADAGNNAIRVIDTEGNVRTMVGNGAPGRRDGAGDKSMFSSPSDVIYDAATCSVLVMDRGNSCIRKISSDTKCSRPQLEGGGTGSVYLGYLGSLIVGAAIASLFLKRHAIHSRISSRPNTNASLHVLYQWKKSCIIVDLDAGPYCDDMAVQLTMVNCLPLFLRKLLGVYGRALAHTLSGAIRLLLLPLQSFSLPNLRLPPAPSRSATSHPERTGATSRGAYSATTNAPADLLHDLISFEAPENDSRESCSGVGDKGDDSLPLLVERSGTASKVFSELEGIVKGLSESVLTAPKESSSGILNLMDDVVPALGTTPVLTDTWESSIRVLSKRHGWLSEEEGLPGLHGSLLSSQSTE